MESESSSDIFGGVGCDLRQATVCGEGCDMKVIAA